MAPRNKNSKLHFHFLVLILSCLSFLQDYRASAGRHYKFIVKEARYERLCDSKNILTINGKYPGPTLHANKGETIAVEVINRGKYNITLHWHGVRQYRNPWSDGPEYVTQCPIKPGKKFRQKIVLSDEEGTVWWHAHSDWTRATVHGAMIIYPCPNTSYPFPKPFAEMPIILGEWWKRDVMVVMKDFLASGGQPNASDALTINGQPGDLFPCSKEDTFRLNVVRGKSYLLRIINAAINELLFFTIANHSLAVVGADGSYTKPLTRDFVVLAPGQTLDCLLFTDQEPGDYYMAAKVYVSGKSAYYDNTTATGIIRYNGIHPAGNVSTHPMLPRLPEFDDTSSATNFSASLRSLVSGDHPIEVPLTVNQRFQLTVSLNAFPCKNSACSGLNGTRLEASMNNITFVSPSVDILKAYYDGVSGVFGKRFPKHPPKAFNFTADFLPPELAVSRRATEARVIRYNSRVEMVFQGTSLVVGMDHPIHLHGYSFYVVGWGFGNFDSFKDPMKYNLVDPPRRNTIAVPKNGWTAIRFRANNPGVWLNGYGTHRERRQETERKNATTTDNASMLKKKMMYCLKFNCTHQISYKPIFHCRHYQLQKFLLFDGQR